MVWYNYVIPGYGMVWYGITLSWYGMTMGWLYTLHWVNLGHGVLYILYLVLPCFSKFILFCYAYMESNLKKLDIIIQFFKAGRQKSIKFIQLLTSGMLPSHDSVDPAFFLSQSKLSIPLQSFGQQNLVLLLIYPMNPRTLSLSEACTLYRPNQKNMGYKRQQHYMVTNRMLCGVLV